VFHHGGAYSLAINVATMVASTSALVAVVNALLTMGGFSTLPPASSTWGVAEWAIFYGILRFQPSTMGRLNESTSSASLRPN
jgi:hypothetical protein